MKKGFILDVYKNGTIDCTNGGISSQHDMIRVTSETTEYPLPAIFDIDCGEAEMKLIIRDVGFARFPIIVPMDYDDKHYMFGGNFAYSSDARFPSDAPIKIFDRHEGGPTW